jgi:heat-inducible transcriptional repressor
VLTPRKIEIFKAIVDEFVATAEPVGSKTLLEKYHLDYSSATIRSEMSELEELGYLEKTHTSSGRVPSKMGYRFYVEHLLEDKKYESMQVALKQVFTERKYNTQEVLKMSCDILSEMTQLTTVVLGPLSAQQTLLQIQLIPLSEKSAMAVFETSEGHSESRMFNFKESVSTHDLQTCTKLLNDRLIGSSLSDLIEKLMLMKPILADKIEHYEMLFEAFFNAFIRFASENIYLSGQNNLMNHPEFADVNKLKQVMKLLENSSLWRSIGTSQGSLSLNKDEGSEFVWLEDMAVVSSTLPIENDTSSKLMVIGPSRMKYDHIVGMMKTLTKAIEDIYRKDDDHEET